MKISMKIKTCCLFMLALHSFQTVAGGITLGATRVIYPYDSRQISLPLKNTDGTASFLVQSWIEDESGNKSDNVIITPPLVMIEPGKENILRIIHAGIKPNWDSETLLWINVKAIPSLDKDIREGNTLQLAVVNRIKLLYRPSTVKQDPDLAYKKLRFKREGNKLTLINPTPFYLTVVNLHAGIQKFGSVMVPPLESFTLGTPVNNSGAISYQTINDYGATTDKETGVFQSRDDMY